jgi:hypothetical protein
MAMGEGDMFEAWLERELKRTVECEPGPRPRSWQALYRSGPLPRRAGLWARITGRGIGVATATALALGGGGVVLAAATTGSVDPVSWGQAVVQVVQRCQDGGSGCALPTGGPTRTDRGGSPSGAQPGAGSSRPSGGRTGTPEPGRAAPLAPQPTSDPAATPDAKPADKGNGNSPKPGLGQGQGNGNGNGQGNGNGHQPPGHASPPPPQAKKPRPSKAPQQPAG